MFPQTMVTHGKPRNQSESGIPWQCHQPGMSEPLPNGAAKSILIMTFPYPVSGLEQIRPRRCLMSQPLSRQKHL